ncbi:DUF2726 domain-containing protein [Avibacterium paragallinarum]|uniref:DUF2726 domain-containing protein n=1 Tax=Avibacterium paragallinarum TaxID=728 RepID=A0A377IDR3_AVIPA|nr:DUF2726 domain-containing protein [Avibacterium paragallinarum]AZI14780.1 DUF2726 domain-containing protein [Avibacterium paragallinarum]KAA6209537.1 DUF2726 domain-containing protein [Avibacterium paragallinarum]POY46044.1 DUF2726 domain-containing protein [Avibacterium paragallinarum]QIR12215.1 DUF2726 domain-containing protein [Avibacterium paragallinarum]QJE08962.1 DUF2726 domain-containing protein [Avibacterium paragallinarum]
MKYLILLLVVASVFWFLGNRNKERSISKQATRINRFNEVLQANKCVNSESDLHTVANNEFRKRWLMHGDETALYWALIEHIRKHHQGQSLAVFAQVSVGEFIWCKNPSTYPTIAAKRVDFLIAQKQKGRDKENNLFEVYSPIAVIEFQGRNHNKDNTSYERDAVKKTVCDKAGITFIEFKENYDDVDFKLLSKELIGVIKNEK